MTHLVIFSMYGEGADPYLNLGLPTTHVQISVRTLRVDMVIESLVDGHRVQDFKAQVDRAALPYLQSKILARLRDVREDALIIYAHSERVFAGVHELILQSGIPYIFTFDETNRLPWTQHHFVASARDRISFSEDAQNAFKRNYLFDSSVFDPEDLESLRSRVELCAGRQRLMPLTKPKNDQDMNVLILSYYYKPALTVAVHRMSYWKDNLNRVAKSVIGESAPNIRTQALTACESYLNDESVLVVRDCAEVDVTDLDVRILQNRLAEARVNWIAVYWIAHIRRWFEQHPDAHFDAIIMSGNPFFYFGLTDYFKDRFGAKVILDFRDPFSSNPRFNYSPEHKALVNELEDQYLDSCDAALTVNRMCEKALRLKPRHKSAIIANGFDETIIDLVKPAHIDGDLTKIKFVYTGKFYADRNSKRFVAALDPAKHRFLHIGWEADADRELDDFEAMERLGVMSYDDVVGHCKSADAGIIFASGDAFEQTTKIFDYIAADIDIIIVTDGEIEYGNLHTMTHDLAGVYWVRNTKRSVNKFIKTYKPKRRRRKQRARFSRGAAAEELVKLLVEE